MMLNNSCQYLLNPHLPDTSLGKSHLTLSIPCYVKKAPDFILRQASWSLEKLSDLFKFAKLPRGSWTWAAWPPPTATSVLTWATVRPAHQEPCLLEALNPGQCRCSTASQHTLGSPGHLPLLRDVISLWLSSFITSFFLPWGSLPW